MKKLSLVFMIILCLINFVGCEFERNPESVYFYDKTSKGSERNVVVVALVNDSEYKEKYFDILVRSDETISIKMCEELKQQKEINLEKDEWTSLSKLLSENEDKFKIYKEVYGKTYLIESRKEINLYFKAIVGDKKENEESLINMIDCSKVFELKTIKNENS